VSKPLFNPGQILATPAFLETVASTGDSMLELLQRHLRGDWGVVCAADADANCQALKDGSRLLSAYLLKDGKTKVWLISEAEDDNGNRAATTGILPAEY
jgi:hypothetical protein